MYDMIVRDIFLYILVVRCYLGTTCLTTKSLLVNEGVPFFRPWDRIASFL